MELTIRIDGLNEIDKEFQDIQNQIAAAVRSSMDVVGIQMKNALKSHIETDVYDYDVYTPDVYKRRSENPALGTPLNDMDANTYIFNKGAGVTLQYLPTGEHTTKKWHDADGDDLVGRIEKFEPPYNWGDAPPRPFFQNFVAEMVDQNELERYFMEAMAGNGFLVESDETGVIRESEDGDY